MHLEVQNFQYKIVQKMKAQNIFFALFRQLCILVGYSLPLTKSSPFYDKICALIKIRKTLQEFKKHLSNTQKYGLILG